ncbi:MAG: hypothetical protein OHK0017_00590 [Patescibacteria group bacterium]
MSENYPYPHLHLLVSGGNSQILYCSDWNDWQIIGKTVDDAAGECFDKVGRMLGLPYPGGIYVSRIAGKEDKNISNFPVGMKHSGDFNFSFSGLKTAVRYYLEKQVVVHETSQKFKLEQPLSEIAIKFLIDHTLKDLQIILNSGKSLVELNEYLEEKGYAGINLEEKDRIGFKLIKEVCISAQSVIIEALTHKVKLAAREFKCQTVGLSGGVSANPMLREKLGDLFGEKLLLAPRHLTGDNAIMIGLAGLLNLKNQNTE